MHGQAKRRWRPQIVIQRCCSGNVKSCQSPCLNLPTRAKRAHTTMAQRVEMCHLKKTAGM